MSRYTINNKETGDQYHIGWDNPTQTYFFQLWSKNNVSDEPDVNIPEFLEQYDNIGEFLILIEKYVFLDPTIVNTLKNDKEGSGEPTPLQKNIMGFFKENFK